MKTTKSQNALRVARFVCIALWALPATSHASVIVEPILATSGGFLNESSNDGETWSYYSVGTTNSGYPEHTVTFSFDVAAPRRFNLDYDIGMSGADFSVISAGVDGSPTVDVSGLFTAHWANYGELGRTVHVREAGTFSVIVDPGHYQVVVELSGITVSHSWRGELVAIPEPASWLLWSIGFLIFMGLQRRARSL